MDRERTRHLPYARPVVSLEATESGVTTSEHSELLERALQVERDRIAAALHDQVLQTFGSCLLKAQICSKLLERGSLDKASLELDILQERLNQAIDEVRGVMSELRTPEPC